MSAPFAPAGSRNVNPVVAAYFVTPKKQIKEKCQLHQHGWDGHSGGDAPSREEHSGRKKAEPGRSIRDGRPVILLPHLGEGDADGFSQMSASRPDGPYDERHEGAVGFE